MILHVVIFDWKDGVTPDQISAFSTALAALEGAVGLMRSLQHGPDLSLREGNGDYVLIATFADEDAWRAYQNHPAHKAFITDHVAPLQQRRTAIQTVV